MADVVEPEERGTGRETLIGPASSTGTRLLAEAAKTRSTQWLGLRHRVALPDPNRYNGRDAVVLSNLVNRAPTTSVARPRTHSSGGVCSGPAAGRIRSAGIRHSGGQRRSAPLEHSDRARPRARCRSTVARPVALSVPSPTSHRVRGLSQQGLDVIAALRARTATDRRAERVTVAESWPSPRKRGSTRAVAIGRGEGLAVDMASPLDQQYAAEQRNRTQLSIHRLAQRIRVRQVAARPSGGPRRSPIPVNVSAFSIIAQPTELILDPTGSRLPLNRQRGLLRAAKLVLRASSRPQPRRLLSLRSARARIQSR